MSTDEHIGELRVMDMTGDTNVSWDRRNRDEVKAAERMFDSLRSKGFSAFSVDRIGRKNELITEFDERLEEIIMVPRIVGG